MTQQYAHLRDEALRRGSDLVVDIVAETLELVDRKVVNLENYQQK